ncbi:MAG TPA: hypothetical protein VK819_06900 [Acidobacteriaceae bacterium]|nr:hypothetical protein [Acidobacteriaceae bacterium]
MEMNRRRFVLSSLGSAIVAPRMISWLPGPSSGPSSSPPSSAAKPYGSGYFGEWIDDENGLPAFRYTCDQINDPKAHTDVSPGVLAPTEHIHQVGNDRIIALASNYGYVRVRQDEGCPKFLNDYDPETSQYAGGIGWLTDGRENLSTLYSGNPSTFERDFGIGYFRKKVSSHNYTVDQTISAPFGDDPVLLSQVTITNHSAAPASLRWVEYWGCQTLEFSFRDFIESWSGIGSPTELRRRAGRNSSHHVQRVDGNRGLIESRHFLGHTPQEDATWHAMRASLAAHPNGFISPVQDPAPGTWFESADPPSTFLVSLDPPATTCSSDGAAFFGAGGPANPSGLAHPLNDRLDSDGPHTALLLERAFQLAPGESLTLSFLYGYVPSGFDRKIPTETILEQLFVGHLVTRYQDLITTSLQISTAFWKRAGLRFSVDSAPWVRRETIWNHYYLRSSLTFDDYFGQHILNQNGFYQYLMGFQGAARDPLQHCLPFLFSNPEIVRSVLRYTLSEVRDNGSVPYGLTGHGVVAPMTADNGSDLPLWLIWAVSEYVFATRDLDFLNEKITAHYTETTGRADTVRNLLARCFHHQMNDVGFGQHGICRMLADDWNDGLLGTWAGSALPEATAQGESVLNSAMSAWVFDNYASMLNLAGMSADLQAQLKQAADKHRTAARSQWTGQWLKRCWLGPRLGWLGESTLWIEPQPWAILGGVTTPEQSRQLIATMNTLLRQGPIGAAQMSNGPDLTTKGMFEPGTIVRGGIWPSLNQTLIWALAGIDPAMAWDEWKKNSFAVHAEAYPDIWYGVWSGTDSYNSLLSKHPGATGADPAFHGTDFPVLNLHSHACFLYSASKVAGIEFTERGLNLKPAIPEKSWRFESPLVGVIRSADGHFEGWYAPSRPGTWTLQIELPSDLAERIARAEVNGTVAPLNRQPNGAFELSGPSALGKPLRWALRSA